MSEQDAKLDKSTAEMLDDQQQEAPEAHPKTRSRKLTKKMQAVIGVIVVVVIAAGAGFWVWHEQPSFCNAICHAPMDPYLPTYQSEPGQASIDKWGNPVSDASSMLAATHRVEGDSCLDCHVPTIGEQISEAGSWVSGGYTYIENPTYGGVITERNAGQLTDARGVEGDEFCLNDSCHHVSDDGSELATRADLEATTADYRINPHSSQHGDVACTTCHKAHRASVNYCTQCHGNAEVPAGWLSVSQANDLTRP